MKTRLLILTALLAICRVPARAADAPYAVDKNTILLLHLDGNGTDAATNKELGKAKGPVQWVPGRFGKAMSVDGKGAILIRHRRDLSVRDRSWTVECWIEPAPKQPANSPILCSVPGYDRSCGIRISGNRRLVGFFTADVVNASYASSGDVRKMLFDGKWQHVAVVRDQSRNGEVRVYIDQRDVTSQQTAMALPIRADGRGMPLTLGSATLWSVGKNGYKGLIDEVRISDIVRPEFAAAADAPPPLPVPTRRIHAGAKMSPDAAVSKKPLTLSPRTTVIVVPGFAPLVGDHKAARLLQEWLRKARRVKTGFPIVNGRKLGDLRGKVALAVGRTQWVTDEEMKGLDRHTVVIRRKGNVVTIFGGADPRTALWASARFLDESCGVRFYMPGDLFTSLPAAGKVTLGAIDRTVEPYVKSCSISGFHNDYRLERPWQDRNAVNRRRGGSHQHNMWSRFPPSVYAKTHPEIYPIRDGKRYIPKDRRDNKWQPCFSAPELVDAAADSTIRYFQQNPEHLYIGFSVMDGHNFCECPRCTARLKENEAKAAKQTNAPRRAKMLALAMTHSPIYWTFMNKLAARLEKELPKHGIADDKLLVGLVYSAARMAPPFKLHRNILVWWVFKWSDGLIDKRLLPNPDGTYRLGRMDEWLRIASHIGHHDWAHGNGFLIPRIYTGLMSTSFRLLKKHDLIFTHTEGYPNWGLDGPKLYIHNKIWWDPDTDVKRIWKQFCGDMFGPARAPMLDYFMTLEALWISLDGDQERKLNRWHNQFVTTAEQRAAIAKCRGLLDRSKTLAATPDQKKRVELFSKSFRMSEYLFELAAAKSVGKARVEEMKRYAREVIAPDPMTIYRRGGKDYVIKQIDSAIRRAGGKRAR